MVIHFLDKNQIRILINQTDLKNATISLEKLISDSHHAVSYIKLLLQSKHYLPTDIILNNYFIYTNNFHIFSIYLSFEYSSQK